MTHARTRADKNLDLQLLCPLKSAFRDNDTMITAAYGKLSATRQTLPLYPVNALPVLGHHSCHYLAMCSAAENMSSLFALAPRGLTGSR